MRNAIFERKHGLMEILIRFSEIYEQLEDREIDKRKSNSFED